MSNRSILARSCAVALLAALAIPSTLMLSQPALAKAEKAPKIKLSGPVQKLLVEVQQLQNKKQFDLAKAKIQEALALPDKTADDLYVISQFRYNLAVSLQDMAEVEAALEGMTSTSLMPEPDRQKAMKNLVNLAVGNKNYDLAVTRSRTYLTNYPTDAEVRQLMARILFVQNHYQEAGSEMTQAIAQVESSGGVAEEDWYQILKSAYYKGKDNDKLFPVLTRLVQRYPTTTNWGDALRVYQEMPGLTDQISIDAFRLMWATGALKGAREYVEMADVALNKGVPGEAESVLTAGQANGVFASSENPQKVKQIVDEQLKLARSRIATDKPTLPGLAKEAATAKTGALASALGDAYLSYGQGADAAAAYRDALAKGGLKNPDQVNLRLGIALVNQGKYADAKAQFARVSGAHMARLAQLWTIYVDSKVNPAPAPAAAPAAQ